MVSDLRAEERVAGLRLLRDQSLEHVLERESRASDGLTVKDLPEPPEPVDVLVAALSPAARPPLRHQLKHAVDHGVAESRTEAFGRTGKYGMELDRHILCTSKSVFCIRYTVPMHS